MKFEHLAVSYWEGRNSVTGDFDGPMSTALAMERDRSGDQYSVLVSGNGRPVVLIDMALKDWYCHLTFFDRLRRVVATVECRQLGEDFVQVCEGQRKWYVGDRPDDDDEFISQRFHADSPDDVTYFPLDSVFPELPSWGPSEEECELDLPVFGDWVTFISRFPYALAAAEVELAADATAGDISYPEGRGLPAGRRPWTPPRPVPPSPYLEQFCTPGARFTLTDVDTGRETGFTIEVEQVGTLRLPTGKLVAEGPWDFSDNTEPFAVTVPPGEYPVLLSLGRWDDEFTWHKQETERRTEFIENFGDHELMIDSDGGRGRSIAAAQVVIRDKPAVSWEMALPPSRDIRRFVDGELECMLNSDGMASYFDVSARRAFAHLHTWLDLRSLRLNQVMAASLDDPVSGANLLVYRCGWGTGCSTWIGRDADGDVVRFVTDMYLVNGFEDAEETGFRVADSRMP